MTPEPLEPPPVLGPLPSFPKRNVFLKKPGPVAYRDWGLDCWKRMSFHVSALIMLGFYGRSECQGWVERLSHLGSEVSDIEWWEPGPRRETMRKKIVLLWTECQRLPPSKRAAS